MKKNKGITLIALIITIIVMLLLVGVTIQIVLNTNLIGTAKKSAEGMDEATIQEQNELNKVDDILLGYTNPWDGNTSEGFAGGSGDTAEDAYIIENAAQLAYFAEQVNSGNTFENKYIKITKSINLDNKKFTPIGKGKTTGVTADDLSIDEMDKSFQGHLDGTGCTITNLYIDETGDSTDENPVYGYGVGLVAVLGEKGSISNLNIYQGEIKGKALVGAIVGVNAGTIENCNNSAIVTAEDVGTDYSGEYVGGIVGWMIKGNINNCNNSATITAKSYNQSGKRGKMSGGIVGWVKLSEDIAITNCTNTGDIFTTYQTAGGIVGGISTSSSDNTIFITDCINSGDVNILTIEGWVTNNYMGTGGIVGVVNTNVKISIEKCSNAGNIMASRASAGGIIGVAQESTECNISQCSNEGEIYAGRLGAGGIISILRGGEISECENRGIVYAGTQQVGGIAGTVYAGTITECSNFNDISCDSLEAYGAVGGIVGINAGGTIASVFNSGNISTGNYNTGLDRAGGIVGYMTTGTVSSSYNKGLVSLAESIEGDTTIDVRGAVVGTNQTGTIENTYYYTTDEIIGIGTDSSDDNTKVTKVSNNINTLEQFLNLLDNEGLTTATSSAEI